MQALNTFLSADSLLAGSAVSRGAVRRPFFLPILLIAVLTGALCWQFVRLAHVLDRLDPTQPSTAALQLQDAAAAASIQLQQMHDVKFSICVISILLVMLFATLAAMVYVLARRRMQPQHRGPSRPGTDLPLLDRNPASLKAFDLNAILAASNHQLRQRERELNEAQRLAHIGSWEWQIEGDRVTWSEEMYRIYQHDLMKPVPNFSEQQKLFTHDSWLGLEQAIKKAFLTGEPYSVELRMAGGEPRTIFAHGEPERDASGKVVLLRGTAQDITERKRLEEALCYQATHDSLTGLPNRTLLMEALARAVSEGGKRGLLTGVLYLDADNFKDLNDSLGHHAGDYFLQRMTERIRSCIRASDTMARMGGDEFVVVCVDLASIAELESVAACLLAEVRRPLAIDGVDFHGSISIGAAVAPRDGESADELLRNADLAMYQTKRFSRDAFMFFAPEMVQKLRSRVDTETHLRLALERDEFRLVYQPRIDLRTGAISGVEALVRWEHPANGLVLPGDFIETAESSGLIVPMGDWVLRTACRQAQLWQASGKLKFPLAVNVSIAQLKQKSFVQTVDAALLASGLAPSLLEVEITESLLLEDAELFANQLHDLKELGVRIAIDDFGTRYSNLNYLRRMPIDTLKIDRSFVHDIDRSPADAAICRSIIALAQNLRLRSVGEGVERFSEMTCLLECGCNDAQGFLFARPQPPEQIETLFNGHHDFGVPSPLQRAAR